MNTQLLGQKVLKVLSVTAALLLGSPVIAAESGAADSLDKNDLKLDKLLQKEGIEVPEKSKASKKDGKTAETSKSTDEKSEKTGISPGKTLSETTPSPFQFLIFFGGAALLALGAWVFKRYRHEFGNGEAIPMDHLQSMQIGHKHQLSVVQVGGETLLLGVTKDNVEMLSKLTDENLGTAQPPVRDRTRAPSPPGKTLFSRPKTVSVRQQVAHRTMSMKAMTAMSHRFQMQTDDLAPTAMTRTEASQMVTPSKRR